MKLKDKKALIERLKKGALLLLISLLTVLPQTVYCQDTLTTNLQVQTIDGEIYRVINEEGANNMASWYIYYSYIYEEFEGANEELYLLEERVNNCQNIIELAVAENALLLTQKEHAISVNNGLSSIMAVKDEKINNLNVDLGLAKSIAVSSNRKSKKKSWIIAGLTAGLVATTSKLLNIW